VLHIDRLNLRGLSRREGQLVVESLRQSLAAGGLPLRSGSGRGDASGERLDAGRLKVSPTNQTACLGGGIAAAIRRRVGP
jgi:hypothetical protein